MQHLKSRFLIVLLALALVGGACGDSDDDDGDAGGQTDDTTATTAADEGPPEFAAGSTMANLQQAGKLRVGVKFDQPGFGLKAATSGDVEGFDVEIAELIAQAIYGGSIEDAAEKLELTEAVSKNREPFIQNGTVDIVIATYTINDTRKEVVDFAGPYFVAQQDIMVKKGDTTIKSVQDLNGKKVCTVQGSTSLKNVQAQAPQADVSTLFDTYSKCAEALRAGRVVAVTTDNTILAGLITDSGGEFELVGAPFSQEPYGIGLKKGDQAFRDFLNDTIEEMVESGAWATAFEETLGELGLETPEPPQVERY